MKKIIVFLLVVLLTISAVTSVTAIRYNGETFEDEMLRLGYTQEDVLELKAILILSEENVSAFIRQKYDELKDWKKVREYYGVSEEKYENYMIGEKMHQETLNSIPDYIFDEMEDRGWTRSEINDFVNKTNISEIDYEYAWKECKKGRTIDDIVEEKKALDDEKSDLDTEFVHGEMTIQEYEDKLTLILDKGIIRKRDNMIADAVKEINELREKTRQRHKETSGITDGEIKYCESQGMTNPMDMYQAKAISTGTNVPFEKVVQTYLKVGSWSVTVIEISDITPEEYIKSLEESIENNPSKVSDNSVTKEQIQQIKDYYSLNESEDRYETVQDNKETEININDYIALMVGSNKSYVYGTEKQLDEQNSDVSVFVEGDRSYVPVRFVSENYGGNVEWVAETQTVNISFDDRKISLTIGKPEIYINGQSTSIDVAPILKNGRTFLPLRACVNALDKEVFYSNGLILIGENADSLDETEQKSVNDIINNYFG